MLVRMKPRDWLDWILAGTGIFGFFADVIAVFSLRGANHIVSPSTSDILTHKQPSVLKGPIDAETVTFIIWLYVAIVGTIVCAKIISSSQTKSPISTLSLSGHLLVSFFFIFVPLLLVIWLWSFGHIPAGLYVFLFPTVIFLGIGGHFAFTESPVSGYALLFGLGPAILWFRAGYDWSFFWIIVITLVALFVGAMPGGFGILLMFVGRETAKPTQKTSTDQDSASDKKTKDEAPLAQRPFESSDMYLKRLSKELYKDIPGFFHPRDDE